MGQIKNIKLHIVTDIKRHNFCSVKQHASQEARTTFQISKTEASRWKQTEEEEVVEGKNRDKLNNAILFDKATQEKLIKEVPSYKLITPSVVSERLKVRASLARSALEQLVEQGLIKEIDRHHAQRIYTRAIKPADE